MSFLRSFLASIVSFTRIPIAWQLQSEDFSKASLQLPLLGLCIGGLQWLFLLLFKGLLAPDLLLFLCLVWPILLSGGMHEDGLADFADGVLGGSTLERRLEIMKDPRIGSYGALALWTVLGLSFLSLRSIASPFQPIALLASTVFSRCLCLALMARLPYIKQTSSRSSSFVPQDFQGWKTWLPLWPALLVLLAIGQGKSIAFYALLSIGLFLGIKRSLEKLLGGLTGDCLGASIKIAEASFLLLASVLWPLLSDA